jgi:hypothetical protein
MLNECQAHYGSQGLLITYKGIRYITLWVQKTQANLHITHKNWNPPVIIKPDSDFQNPALISDIENRMEETRQTIDSLVANKKK